MTHASRALRSRDLSREEITFGSHTYFLDHTRTRRAPRMSDQLNSGATFETTQTLKRIHTIHSHIHSNKADMIRMIMMVKWYSGNHGGLKLPDICLTGEKKPRRNLTQETCLDRGSNTGPLRGKRACYRLLHSDGHKLTRILSSFIKILFSWLIKKKLL